MSMVVHACMHACMRGCAACMGCPPLPPSSAVLPATHTVLIPNFFVSADRLGPEHTIAVQGMPPSATNASNMLLSLTRNATWGEWKSISCVNSLPSILLTPIKWHVSGSQTAAMPLPQCL